LQPNVRKFQFCHCKLIAHPNIAKSATLDPKLIVPTPFRKMAFCKPAYPCHNSGQV
jgi:hypothetical protein